MNYYGLLWLNNSKLFFPWASRWHSLIGLQPVAFWENICPQSGSRKKHCVSKSYSMTEMALFWGITVFWLSFFTKEELLFFLVLLPRVVLYQILQELIKLFTSSHTVLLSFHSKCMTPLTSGYRNGLSSWASSPLPALRWDRSMASSMARFCTWSCFMTRSTQTVSTKAKIPRMM